MEKVIYSDKGGLGIISDSNENENDFIQDTSFLINGIQMNPGEKTTLFGMFEKEVKFVGSLTEDAKCMVFYLGQVNDLFESKKYYSCFYWIAENRILNKYQEYTARDFLFVNGKWK